MSGKSLKEVNWAKVGVSALSGGVSAAVPGGFITAAVIGGTTDVAFDAIDGNINSVGDAVKSFAWGAVKEVVSQGVGKALDKGIGKLAGKFAGKSGTATINPNDIRFSQSSVNGASEIIDSMKAKGWDGDPIDVVRMPDGNLTTIDNTRVLAARYAEIDVQANVHAFDEVLPQDLDLIERLTTPKGVPQTWGDAVLLRIGKQNRGYRNTYPLGSNIIGWSGN